MGLFEQPQQRVGDRPEVCVGRAAAKREPEQAGPAGGIKGQHLGRHLDAALHAAHHGQRAHGAGARREAAAAADHEAAALAIFLHISRLCVVILSFILRWDRQLYFSSRT